MKILQESGIPPRKLAALLFFPNTVPSHRSPPLTEGSIVAFKECMKEYEYSPNVVLPRGSYLISPGNMDACKRKKYTTFIPTPSRNTHLRVLLPSSPGSTVGPCSTDECLSRIRECVNQAYTETSTVITVLEIIVSTKLLLSSMSGPFAADRTFERKEGGSKKSLSTSNVAPS